MKNFRAYILDLCGKKEGYTIEFKGAKGGFPGSFWETYSAFANTAGGIIVLGVIEKNHRFKPDGLTEDQIEHYRKTFWDNAHNPQKVSACLLNENDVIVDHYTDGSFILIFKIPRASFDVKPVYINGNPKYAFRRNHEGDYICTQSEISRMYAEADVLVHPLDSTILKNYDLKRDFDKATIDQYRQLFKLNHTGHAWNELTDIEFLKKIEGYRVDYETGEEGFTLAAVLMFGNELALRAALPHYFVDYREKLSSDPRIRYTNRIYPDGTWEPNLFQFFFRVTQELYHAVPIPFRLEGLTRIDETPAHESIREAICNCMIHAQWRMLEGIVIERYRDRLYFSNPGTMLVPVEEFFEGGHSICRNQILQKMFIAIGRGERLGSGADIIRQGWKENNWPEPELKEHFGPNTDRVELTLQLGSITSQKQESEVKSEVKGKVKTKVRIKELMQTNKYITYSEIAQEIGISVSGVEKSVRKMRENEEILRHGAENGGYWEVLK